MQQEEKAVFIFKKCSYEELQAIQHREDLLLSGWTLTVRGTRRKVSWTANTAIKYRLVSKKQPSKELNRHLL